MKVFLFIAIDLVAFLELYQQLTWTINWILIL